MARQPATFANVDTAADDTCLMAFTSGTTGQPKGTMHFHRDVMAACACWPPHVLRPTRRRRLHRQPAAGLHLRPGRPAAVPDERRRLHACWWRRSRRRTLMAAIAAVRRHGDVHRADLVPRDRAVAAGQALAGDAACASACRPARRCPRPRASCGGRHRPRDHRRHRLHRAAAHLHLAPTRRDARPGATGKAVPGYVRLRHGRRGPAAAARPGGRAGGQGPDRLQLPGRRAPGAVRAATAGTTPATPTCWTTTATSTTSRAPTT